MSNNNYSKYQPITQQSHLSSTQGNSVQITTRSEKILGDSPTQEDAFEIETVPNYRMTRKSESNIVGDLWRFIGMTNSMPEATNVIRTSKYTTLSFLPLNFLHQLLKPANLYFIVICCLQMIKPISITGGSPTNLPPLLFVMAVSGIKDFFEDRVRQKSDAEENDRSTSILGEDGNYVSAKWRDIKVGDVIMVKENEFLPADIIILRTSLDNVCYIETKNLDGETNLKHKSAPSYGQEQYQDLEFSRAVVACEQPSDKIYQFQGVMSLSGQSGEQVVLRYENFALRGCSLRNTDFIVGLVTFTGADTRIMRNSVRSRAKFSNLEKQTGIQIIFVFLTMMVCCACAATVVLIWNRVNDNSTNSYLDFYSNGQQPQVWNAKTDILVWLKAFGTWILLFTNMVPISLLVSLEIVKFSQALFIGWDFQIYSLEKDMPTKVQSNNLNEELGQIEYIFSDKTGTLTCNVMDFRKLSAGFVSYGVSSRIDSDRLISLQSDSEPLVSNVNFDSTLLKEDLIPGSKNYIKAEALLLNLALNHSVMVGQKGYCASSPDELALVNVAKFVGFKFVCRDTKENTITICIRGKNLVYQQLQVIDFTSARKRMTTIFRDPQGEVIVFCKGADSVLFPLCSQGQDLLKSQTQNYMDAYAKEGLRTLLFAQKKISKSDYIEWAQQYQEASLRINDRDEQLDRVASLIETEFEIVGSTAIEDRLQQGVPEAINHIRQAGIKLWVLTGDKIETAINIGYSSGLIDNNQQQYIIDATSSAAVYRQLTLAENNLNLYIGSKNIAVIVAGDSLIKISQKEALKQKFVQLIEKSSVVLACRVSPIQKAEIVNIIREAHPQAKTLAIGDGANDVNMITAAHVGVGISGLEGQQAARSSDYAIAQFSYLIPLMFYHGREAYRRNSYLVIYMFYKNVLFVLPQFWFGFVSAFSGQTLYESWLYQGYNIVYTSFPIMWFAVYDLQYTKERFITDPSLYQIGLKNVCFSTVVFFQSIFNAIINALFIMMICFRGLDGHVSNNQGKSGSFWVDGTMVYAVVVLVVNLKIVQKTNSHTWVSTALISASILLFWLQLAAESAIPYFSQVYRMFPGLIASGKTYSILFLCGWLNMGQFIAYFNIWRWNQERQAEKLQTVVDQYQEILDDPEDENPLIQGQKVVVSTVGQILDKINPVLTEREQFHGYAFSQEDSLTSSLLQNKKSISQSRQSVPTKQQNYEQYSVDRKTLTSLNSEEQFQQDT